jgi:hypothetical protein
VEKVMLGEVGEEVGCGVVEGGAVEDLEELGHC